MEPQHTATAGVGWAVRSSVRTLHPGYFALVMATSIVSLGLHGVGATALSTALVWVAVAGYAILLVLYGWRAVAYSSHMRADLADPARAFGFFTFVAGTNVLGARLAVAGHFGVAGVLLAVGTLGWLVLGYAVPWNAVLSRTGRPLVAAANGTWFIWVVATQSVAALAATMEPWLTTGRHEAALLAVCCWSVGALLYAAVGVLVAARLLLHELSPVDLTPPYWVAMGASAISVLAGARILQMAEAPALTAIHDVVVGVSLAFWAFGTWLVPALVAAGWWRHVVHRVPLRYEATWWSIVFPLGMYGVASCTLGSAADLPIVGSIGRAEVWVALVAWVAVGAAMLAHLARSLLWRPAPATKV